MADGQLVEVGSQRSRVWVVLLVVVVLGGALWLRLRDDATSVEPSPATTTTAAESLRSSSPPVIWGLLGDDRALYEPAILRDVDGSSITRLARVGPRDGGRAALFLSTRAAEHRGRTLRFEATIRADEAGAIELFLSVDEAEVRSDPLTGTTDWVELAVELDVPNDAEHVLYGVSLQGRGSVSVKGSRLAPVPRWVFVRRPRQDSNLRPAA